MSWQELSWRSWATIFVACAFVFRVATFGNPALHTDEEFYFLIGQWMLDGKLPYVDVWDRKPFGLFLIYAGIAAISRSVIAYQVAATISAAATAFVLSRIVGGAWPQRLMAGVCYLAMLPLVGGHGGQTPVFYNLPMAIAALLVIQSLAALDEGRVPRTSYAAILLGGFALTIKQTTVVESAFFGLFMLGTASRAGMTWPALSKRLVIFGSLGLAPMAAITAFYAVQGHWQDFFQAMVTSNMAKLSYPAELVVRRSGVMFFPLVLPFSLAALGLIAMPRAPLKFFLGGWLLVAVAALWLVPNFYWHYALPLLLPISCLVAQVVTRFRWFLPFGLAMAATGLSLAGAFDRSGHLESLRQSRALAAAIQSKTLLVYDGPVYLYALSGAKPLSRLVLPHHFRELVEFNSSGQSANAELARLLQRRPEAVTLHRGPVFVIWENQTARRMVERYVVQHCRPAGIFKVIEYRMRIEVVLHSKCI